MPEVNQQQNIGTAAVPAQQKKKSVDITYSVAGQDVHLNYNIVRDFLVKGNGDKVSDQDLMQFISICKYNQLNPFLNEAYLVKYGTAPATMIVSKEALMKRAEACEGYEGFEAGIIVMKGEELIDRQGCFAAPGEKLVGGWAIVHRSDRKFPIISRVSIEEYNQKQSLWNAKPSTMIRKVAIVQALREAFPAQLGAMYTQEEKLDIIDGATIEVKEEIKTNANRERISFDSQSGSSPISTAATDETPSAAPAY